MRRAHRRGSVGAAAVLVSVLALLGCHAEAPVALPMKTTVVLGARLWDGTGSAVVEDAAVVIDDDRIVAIGPRAQVPLPPPGAATVVHLEGGTIVPGLINAHGHLGLVVGAANRADGYTREAVAHALDQYERYGVLTVLSLGLNRDLLYGVKEAQAHRTFFGATVFTADRGLGVPGGAPPLPVAADQVERPASEEEARSVVRAMAARHADFVKIWVDDLHDRSPKMGEPMYRAIIDEAHAAHLRVAAHVYELDDAKRLLGAGVDVLAHSVRDRPLDHEALEALRARRVFYIPTLTVDESAFVFADDPQTFLRSPLWNAALLPEAREWLTSEAYREKVQGDPATKQHRKDFEVARANLLLAKKSGVRVAFGTDSGAMVERIPGFAEHRELALMVQAGLSPVEALTAATRTNAELLRVNDQIGTLERGKRASFMVVRGDPLTDIGAMDRLMALWHDGRRLTPALE